MKRLEYFATKKSGELLNLEGEDKSKFDTYRQMLIDNEINLLDICERGFDTTTSNIAPLSHWITPEFEARRFDTRFFIAYLPENQIVQI